MIGCNYATNPVPEQPVITSEIAEPISEGLLLAWDGGSETPAFVATGINGSLASSTFYEIDDTAGSTDGSYGSAFSTAATEASAFAVREVEGADRVTFTLKNETGLPLRLDAVHFDYAAWWEDSPHDIALLYGSGDLEGVTNQTDIQTVTGLSSTGKKNNYADFDWTLSGLPDRVLAHGEVVNLNLVVSNSGAEWANGAFDNLALSGGTVSNSADTVLISWRAETGTKYEVMESANLLSNDWNSASGILIENSGDISVPVELKTPSFYRLEIEP